jgi:hypothetical protein
LRDRIRFVWLHARTSLFFCLGGIAALGQTSQVSIVGLSPATVAPNGALTLQMSFTNTGSNTWAPVSPVSCEQLYSPNDYVTSCRPYPDGAGDYGFQMIAHALDAPDWLGTYYLADGAFPHAIAPGETIHLSRGITASLPPGRYRMMVYTQRAWYYAFTSRILHNPADAMANAPTADFVVASDVTPPSVTTTGLLGNACSLWPPNGQLVDVGTISASDSQSAVASVRVDVTSNDPTMVAADDVQVEGGAAGPLSVKLRARRSGFGGDRLYDVVITATDTVGNAAVVRNQCIVPHDQKPK